MKVVNIQEAKTHLSRLVEEVLAGEELVLAKAGKPLVKVIPFQASGTPRLLGTMAGQILESPGCWDDDPEVVKAFYGEEIFSPLLKAAEEPPPTP